MNISLQEGNCTPWKPCQWRCLSQWETKRLAVQTMDHGTQARISFSIWTKPLKPTFYYKTMIFTCPSSLKLRLLQFSLAVPRSEQERRKISNSWVSRKDEAIFRCFVSERFASASEIWFISHVNCDKSCTPIIQCSTEPFNHK